MKIPYIKFQQCLGAGYSLVVRRSHERVHSELKRLRATGVVRNEVSRSAHYEPRELMWRHQELNSAGVDEAEVLQ